MTEDSECWGCGICPGPMQRECQQHVRRRNQYLNISHHEKHHEFEFSSWPCWKAVIQCSTCWKAWPLKPLHYPFIYIMLRKKHPAPLEPLRPRQASWWALSSCSSWLNKLDSFQLCSNTILQNVYMSSWKFWRSFSVPPVAFENAKEMGLFLHCNSVNSGSCWTAPAEKQWLLLRSSGWTLAEKHWCENHCIPYVIIVGSHWIIEEPGQTCKHKLSSDEN